MSRVIVDKTDLKQVLAPHARKALLAGLNHIKTEAKKKTPVGVTGLARAGIDFKIESDFKGYVGPTGAGALYYAYIEDGRAPGKQPPIDAIELWAQRVAKADPFLIARAIGHNGVIGKHIFKNIEENDRSKIEQIVSRVLKSLDEKI